MGESAAAVGLPKTQYIRRHAQSPIEERDDWKWDSDAAGPVRYSVKLIT
jgi:hypothetical protein